VMMKFHQAQPLHPDAARFCEARLNRCFVAQLSAWRGRTGAGLLRI